MKLQELAIYTGAGALTAYAAWKLFEKSVKAPLEDAAEEFGGWVYMPDDINEEVRAWYIAQGYTASHITRAAAAIRRVFPALSAVDLVAASINGAQSRRVKDALSPGLFDSFPPWRNPAIWWDITRGKRISECVPLNAAYSWLVTECDLAAEWAAAQ